MFQELIATITALLASAAEEKNAPSEQTAMPDTVEMLTVKECCSAVKGLNEYTVRQLIARDELPYVRCGQGKRGKILIPKAALLTYFSGWRS